MLQSIDIMRCTLTKESTVDYNAISGSQDVVSVAKSLGLHEAADEYMYMFCLTTKGDIAGIHQVSHGDLSSSIIHPREIFKRALLNNSAGIVLVHNHPSGDVEPSRADIDTTERIDLASDIIGIKLIDHIIIGGDDYFSMKADGLL